MLLFFTQQPKLYIGKYKNGLDFKLNKLEQADSGLKVEAAIYIILGSQYFMTSHGNAKDRETFLKAF